MFICENPSISGIRSAHVDTIDGRAPDIEAQWWGGRNNPAAKRFRPVLHQLGLKTTRPDAHGGWNCYITNVVKEANVAGVEQRAKSAADRKQQARDWADVLTWEYSHVQPTHVFAVGGAAYQALKLLLRERLLPPFTVHPMGHYSARGRVDRVMQQMLLPLRTVLNLSVPKTAAPHESAI